MSADTILTFLSDLTARSPLTILSDRHISTPTAALPPDVIRHRERLRAGFALTRQLIVTYQLAIVAFLLCTAAWHHYARWQRRRSCMRKRKVEREGDSIRVKSCDAEEDKKHVIAVEERSASSLSSTSSIGTDDAVVANERTALLGANKTRSRSRTRVGALLDKIHAISMYQPAPTPIVRKVLPSNGESLVILVLLGINLFYLLYQIDGLDVLPARAGAVFVANLPWLYLLAAKNQPIQFLTGHSYENLNMIHRRLGEYMCTAAAIHFAGMILAWYRALRPLGFSLIRFLTVRYILWGVGAFLSYELLALTSLKTFRDYWYEIFLGSHIVLQLLGLITLYLHHWIDRPYVLAALTIFLTDRLLYRATLKSHSVPAILRVADDDATVLVSATWPLNPRHTSPMSLIHKTLSTGWHATAHIFITIPALSRKHAWQSHPITIASPAPTPQSTTAEFKLIIRAQEGFSADLLRHARKQSAVPTTIRLDGPYGSSHALELARYSQRVLIVAGGSGIAVAWPLIWDLLQGRDGDGDERGDVERGWRTEEDCGVALVWIVQDPRHYSWIGGREKLEELRERGVRVVVPAPTRVGGRPDVRGLVRGCVEELTGDGEEGDRGETAVVVSGPDELNRDVVNACAGMRWEGERVSVVVEKFGL